MAWTPEDQPRLPVVWANFRGELSRSTNLLWRLEAHALMLTTNTDMAALGAAITNFYEEIFTNRAELVANPVDILYDCNWDGETLLKAATQDSVFSENMERLQGAYLNDFRPRLEALDEEYRNQTVPAAETARVFEQQKAYLRESTSFDFFKFSEIFQYKSYNQQQAAELLPLILAYKSNLLAQAKNNWKYSGGALTDGDASSVEFFLQQDVEKILHPQRPSDSPAGRSTSSPVAATPAVQPAGPAEPAGEKELVTNELNVDHFLELPPDSPGVAGTGAIISAHHCQENKLVLDLDCHAMAYSPDGKNDLNSLHYEAHPAIAILDVPAEKWNVIHCLAADVTKENRFYHRTTLWRGKVFTSNGGQIQKYDPAGKTWRPVDVPGASNCELFTVNDHLYAATSQLIVEIIGDGQGTRILASNRRQPAASTLDLEDLGTPFLFAGPGHALRAVAGGKVAEWNGTDWRILCPAPSVTLPPVLFEDGVLFTGGGRNSPAGFWRLAAGSDAVEYCLGQEPGRGSSLSQSGKGWKARPTWNVFEQFRLGLLPAASHESSLLLMTGLAKHQKTMDKQQPANPTPKTLSQAGYHVGLLCFLTNQPVPLHLYLKFAALEGVVPPISTDEGQTIFFMPELSRGWMEFADGRLFLGREFASHFAVGDTIATPKAGVWVLPQDQLDSELARLIALAVTTGRKDGGR